ncbi:MAG: hypothetical protein KGO81_00050 [Bacteroidota bacterium]|nr:hypothetical protein [Bacteroidota bacterium]
MKRSFLVFIFLITASVSFACPICGCGGGSMYMGLLPNFQSKFIGVRYHYAAYHTQLANNPGQFSDNYYNITELWGGINIGSKFKVLGFVPYYFNKQSDDDGVTYKNGLGDITLLGQYKIWSAINSIGGNKVLHQQLWIGGGVKLPTGIFNINVNDTTTTIADINAQLGTGSIDFILNGMYSFTAGNFGFNTSVTYKINSQNKDRYLYGNKFTLNSIAYYNFSGKKMQFSPNIGIGYENTASNELYASKVRYTGSRVTTVIAGLETSFNSIGIGINAQLPIQQDFAEGQTKLNMKAMAHITFSF